MPVSRLSKRFGMPLSGGLACLLSLGVVPAATLAQEPVEPIRIVLQGTIRDSSSKSGVGQVLVEVYGPEGERFAFDVTNDQGVFHVEVKRAEAYVVETSKLGFGSRSTVIRVPVGQNRVSLNILLGADPVALRELRVSIEGRCEGRRSDSVLEAYEAYARVIPFFRLIEDVETEQRLIYRLALFEKLNVKDPRRLIKQHGLQVARPDTVVVSTPLWSPPAKELVRRGYVVSEPGGVLRYYAPTASILASESFRAAHCFWIEDVTDGVLHLGFEPENPKRPVPDVSGVIRIDASRGVPLAVEFQYESTRNLIATVELPGLRRHMEERATAWSPPKRVIMGPLEISSPIGGRLTFGEVARGVPVTREWELRIPIVYSFNEFSRGRIQVWPKTLERTRTGKVLEVLRLEK